MRYEITFTEYQQNLDVSKFDVLASRTTADKMYITFQGVNQKPMLVSMANWRLKLHQLNLPQALNVCYDEDTIG